MKIRDKELLRERIWDIIDCQELSKFPKSVRGRIPNFKGAFKAAQMLKNTYEWMNSKIIFSSPDSAQMKVREYALMDGKTLIMASPKLKRGYLLIRPENASGHEKEASTIKGAFRFGESIKEFPEVDLVVEGSVAVDFRGGRLGKGGGYGDKEISHLFNTGSISESTPIVTTVHEVQIMDEIPLEVHDEKINMIVTPERVIRI